jgi:hypothetical protein
VHAVHAAIGAFRTVPSFLHAPLPDSSPHVGAHAMYPSVSPNYLPGVEHLAPLDIDGLTSTSSCVHPAGESANGYTQAVASLLGGCAALLPMVGERTLHESGCAKLRELLMLTAPLGLAGLLYLMSVVETVTPYSGAYVLFHVSFELMRVVCEAEGARCIASYRATGAPRYAATQFQLLASIFVALFACYAGIALCRALQRVSGGGSGGEDTVASSPPSPPEQHYQPVLSRLDATYQSQRE